MKKSLAAVLFLLLTLGTGSAAAQAPIPTPFPTPVRNVSDERDLPQSTPEITPKNSRAEEEKYLRDDDDDGDFRPLSAIELKKVARQRIKMSDAEKQIYKRAAKADDLKILKIFAAPQCAENRLVLDARDEKCAAAADLLRISFYSFLRGFYGERIGDFRILEDNLIAGNGRYIHGFLVDLGEGEIGKISRESTEVTDLRNYPVARSVEEESAQRKDLENGINHRNLSISSTQKLKPNHIYLMRLVNYSFNGDWHNIYNKDSIYVLKVGGLNNEQMAIILWKKLSEQSAPRLKSE